MAPTFTSSLIDPSVPLHLLMQSGRPIDLSDPGTRWGLIGLAVAAGIYVLVLRPMRRKKDPLERSPVPSSLAQQRAVEREMSNLLVELSEMARQMTAQLDTRAARLETLIKQADDRLAALQAGVTSPPAPAEGRGSPASNGNGMHGAGETPPPAPPAIDPRHGAVYALADQGRSLLEIAQELGRPTGEIELILALRHRG